MSTFILMYFMYHDREGILPLNSFATKTAPGPDFADKVNFHLSELLAPFFMEEIPDSFFWIQPVEQFDPEEEEGYGYVYSEQLKDEKLPLPFEPYDAAVILAKLIIAYIEHNDGISNYTLIENYNVDDISTTAPVIDETVPVDPRFIKGETVVNIYGDRFTYRGALHYPLNIKYGELHAEADHHNKNVKIGVKNNDYVPEKAIIDFLNTNDIPIYPLPSVAKRHLAKGTKWFTLSPDGKIEGYGKTQKRAKELLAFRSLI